MYKLCFYVPKSHLEAVKKAVFDAGAGRQGNYDHCCTQFKVEGQFRPLAGSTPYLGKTGAIETVAEIKVEMLCAENCIHEAVTALKSAHPYEEPAFDVWKLIDVS